METKEIKKLPLVKQSASYKIIIPDSVERQIRFLCERVWDTEWSGVLFYTPSGDFADGSLEIHCVDIFPMDVGNATYTEFNMSPDVISYMAQKPELLDCKMGLIHSHDNMPTFFSGTDLETLKEEGNERNHFVSLIVNNAGVYTAAITRKVKYHSVRDISYEGFEGPVFVEEPEVIEGEEIEYFNLDIVFEEETENPFQEIAARLADIKKKKAEARAKTVAIPAASTKFPISTPTNTYKTPTLFDDDADWEWGYYGGKPISKKEEPVLKESKKKPNFAPFVDEEIFNDVDVEKIINQLITGSVTITSLDKSAKEKMLKCMEAHFDNRFGKNDPALTLFEYWATDFLEFLIWYSTGDKDVDECLAAEELAGKLVDALSELPSNKYIEKYIELLASYADKF